jgi:hypothetical protein
MESQRQFNVRCFLYSFKRSSIIVARANEGVVLSIGVKAQAMRNAVLSEIATASHKNDQTRRRTKLQGATNVSRSVA